MAITLAPTVALLGIMAPRLGPWFSTAVPLGAMQPGQKLGLTVTFPAATDWFAPATGTLSLFVSNPGSIPPALDALQDSDGNWPFPAGRLVAHFRLLPEVEARLHALMGLVPAATANAVANAPTVIGVPTRPQVRSLALVLPAAVPLTPAGVYSVMNGAANVPGNTDAERMAALGLALNGGNVVNAALPMTWLRRPGGALADRDRLLFGLTGQADLWAFDRRGRAIDPGAVACWWSWLLNTAVGNDPATGAVDYQLFAPDLALADYPQNGGVPFVVGNVAAQRTIHVVDAHEGPIGAPFLNGRLRSAGAAVTGNLIGVTGNAGTALRFSNPPANPAGTPLDNPAVDDAPRPRLAVLPNGAYANTVQPNGQYGNVATLWPGGPVHAGLTRDFVRVAVLDEEAHLTGLSRRDSRAAIANAGDRRRSAQNRPSTRIGVARTANQAPVLLANGQATAAALLALPNAANPTRMVLGLADAAWGAGAALPAAGPGALPATLADSGGPPPAAGQYRVLGLLGGGASIADEQIVLVELHTGIANAWVRCWPVGFDLAAAERFRLTGGAGLADANGLARLTMLLPNGRTDASGLLGMDVLVVLAGAPGTAPVTRSYADRRFQRPAAVAGAPPVAIGGGTGWWVCETGATGQGALPNGAVPPGGRVVLLGNPPALLDRTAIPAAAWAANTLRNRLQATDMVSLTAPAFDATPDRLDAAGRPLPRIPATPGAPDGGLAAILAGAGGASTLHRLDRSMLSGATASSVPYALLDRLEVAAATVGGGAATAVVGALPPVPWAMEPASDFALGHPGVPAAIERHGTGVALTGAPAVAVAEYLRERTAGLSFGFLQTLAEPGRSAALQSELAVAAEAAQTVLPQIAEPAAPGPVVAVLRTVAAGMEGMPGAGLGATTDPNLFPFSRNELALEAWLDSNIPLVPGGAGNQLRAAAAGPIDSMTRALDRRILASAYGAREAMTALMAAIGRAQDLIYVETPAIDAAVVDVDGEALSIWAALMGRMGQRPGLRLVLCVPSRLGPGTPRKLQAVRDEMLLNAVGTMRAQYGARFALFSPGAGAGRAVRFASTSVVVDDAFALTGTTHLWRRGLSFDSSLAAAVFDERLVDGRPQDPRAFRIQLMADRLGIPATRLPDDPAELVAAIRTLDARGGARLSAMPIRRPATPPTLDDIRVWNADGAQPDALTAADVVGLVTSALAQTGTEHAIVEG